MPTTRRIVFTKDAQFSVSEPVTDKPVTVSGYCCIWNVLSTDRGGYFVRLGKNSAAILPGCLAIYQHDVKLLVGSTDNGTLRYASDDVGLHVDIDLPDTTTGRDVAELIRKKYISGMSFGLALNPEPVMDGVIEDGKRILDISKFSINEVTITAIPAFSQTSIEISSDEVEFVPQEFARRDAVRKGRVKINRLRLDLLKS